VLILVPQRRRQRTHVAMQDSVEVGDDIITAGGLHGEVVSDEGETLEIEIAPEVVVRLDRRAVAAVARDLDDLESADDEPHDADELAEPGEATEAR
jgi:preprotein translocase subunit YajC